ncbi:DUF1833 family protein [Chelatococcus sp. GCM10030263]|uniref:DUF1833 family protein n=1 Tax=Chelatococcus sp. GCM10030263 TaxID=3273387 RepID=UPI00360D1316
MVDFWTPEFAINMASDDKTDVAMETLELHHPAFIEIGVLIAIRAVNQLKDKVLTLDLGAPLQPGQAVTFNAIPFMFDFPSFEEGRAPEATVTVDNIGREVDQYLDVAETMYTDLVCIYRVYMSSDPTTVAYGPFRFVMREVATTGASVSGSVTVATAQNLKYLRKLYTSNEYPSLLAAS